MNKYVPSPVPIIWFGRSALVRWVLDSVSLPAVNSETYQELNNKCSKYKNIFPPKDYLKGDFSFKRYNSNWGIGIRVQVLGAPMRMDFGIPITTDEFNDEGNQFHFTFGPRF